MKKNILILLGIICSTGLSAQSAAAAKQAITYTPFMTLAPGEKVIPLHSCMWLNANNIFYRLVIQQASGKYSMITGEGRKDNLSLKDVLDYSTGSNCSEKDPHRPRKSTRYTGAKLVTFNGQGKAIIVAGKKSYGPYEEVIFIEERGERFVAVVRAVKNGKQQMLYIDTEGRQYVLKAKPLEMIVNAACTNAALVMPPADALPMEMVNNLPQEKKVELLDRLSKKDQVLWFNNDSSTSLARPYRRLEYDASGRHFLKVYMGYFLIDGKRNDVNISGAGTRLFAGKDPANWAYYFQGYLHFSDRTNISNAINPFLTTENGKDYLNWFVIASNSQGDIIKWGRREL